MLRVSKSYGKTVRDRRRGRNLTQTQLAAAAGISQQELSAIEHGKEPAGDAARKINEQLEISWISTYDPDLDLEDPYLEEVLEDFLDRITSR